jgi:hypothetical protein
MGWEEIAGAIETWIGALAVSAAQQESVSA